MLEGYHRYMEVLIIAVVAGIGIAYFATQNPITIPITLASYHFFNIPLYILVAGSLLFGLLVAWIISLFSYFGNSILFHRQNNRIQKDNKLIQDLTNRIHELEIENTRLKEHNTTTKIVSSDTTRYDHPSLLTRFRQSMG